MRIRNILTALILILSIPTFAQVTVSLGVYSGAGSTNVLLSTSTTINRYSRTISLYTASEIISAGGMAGTIGSLAWDKYGTGEYTSANAYIKIYLKHASASAWPTSPVPDWNTEVAGATEVFTSTTYSIPTGTGWKTLPFTTPFIWNGTDNIAVFVEWDRASAPTADISWGRSTTTNANATRVGSASLAALVMIVNSNRPLLQLTINPATPIQVASVTVTTQGSVPALISTASGTLQMQSTILPANANQAVTWSLISGTGSAGISASGLVTALANGTVWAKAVSVQDTTKMDSMQISISNQIIPISSITVSTVGGAPAAISTDAGSLQLVAQVSPANANQSVNWSIIPGTGTASITGSGLVTAISDGTVWSKAVSVQDPSKMDSLLITITNQIVPITSLTVSTFGAVPAVITTKSGTLQMVSTVLPGNANQAVTWSVVPGSGSATISSTGLLTAQTNGTAWAKAVSIQNISKRDSLMVTITNQNVGLDEDLQSRNIFIYPNPTSSGFINLELIDYTIGQHVTYRVYDIFGRVLLVDKLNIEKIRIDASTLGPGTYILQISDGNAITTKTFGVL